MFIAQTAIKMQHLPMAKIGKALKTRAKELGMSDAEVARQCGWSPERYGSYARDRTEPDFKSLMAICRVLRTTPNRLLSEGLYESNASPFRGEGEPIPHGQAYIEADKAPPPLDDEIIGDLMVGLEKLHIEEGIAISLKELTVLAVNLFYEYVATDRDHGVERALAAQGKWLKKQKKAILMGPR